VFRNLTRGRGLRLLAATMGVGALVALGGGAVAQASTVQASGGHGQPVLLHVTSEPRTAARAKAIMATLPYPSNCAYNDATCTYDTGWTTYNNGGCEARVIATWWGTPKNILNVTVDVQSPYLFAGCRAYGNVYFGMNSGPPVSGGSFYSYACAVLDPTCSDNQSWSYEVNQAVPQAQFGNLNSIYATITD
jgi:hypothetical protein